MKPVVDEAAAPIWAAFISALKAWYAALEAEPGEGALIALHAVRAAVKAPGMYGPFVETEHGAFPEWASPQGDALAQLIFPLSMLAKAAEDNA